MLAMLASMTALHATEAATFRCTGFAFLIADMTCTTGDAATPHASFCDVMNRQGGAVRWSRADTAQTKARADLINAAGKELCGWQRPAK